MTDVRRHDRVIHRIGQVANERDVDAPPHHLLDENQRLGMQMLVCCGLIAGWDRYVTTNCSLRSRRSL